jgi:hypothetical protein
MRGNYSVKSDAFSFGVMVLEIVTGRKNSGSYNSKQSADLLNTVSCEKPEHLNRHCVAASLAHGYKPPCRFGSIGRPGR